MRQLLPTPIDEVDPFDLYPADARPAPADRPWLLCNMIASADGATALRGRSGGLGGPADRTVFRAIRASCDWVLVGSGTAVAEAYRVPSTDPVVETHRLALGRASAPRLAIVTASGMIDPTIPAFSARPADADAPLVIAGAEAASTALDALDAEIVRVPHARPEPHAILEALHRRGAVVVLAEGGPTFNGVLDAAGVIDELCLTIAPLIVGGTSPRIVDTPGDGTTGLHLDRLLEQDGALFARYLTQGTF